ncbi:MAG: hypothetical protein U9R69_09185 [Thermodesulfobacteriota bacterium]|nr:hypothetical protein [Thermodesulfobacteriota bacterium]
MENAKKQINQIDPFKQKNYTIETLDDEIRVDQLSQRLLKQYHQYLLDINTSPLESGSMAGGADFFLRHFMIDNRRTNIFEISPELIHAFAGNWYIVNTLEPNMVELESFLVGIAGFYDFCAEKKIIDPVMAEKIGLACTRCDFYRQRIESFNDLCGDGFTSWNSNCPLE